MKTERTLAQRIARAFMLLAMAVAGFFCLASYVAVEMIEYQVIDKRLNKTAGTLIARHLHQDPVDPPPEISFFADAGVPDALRRLGSGIHEAVLDGREVVALVRFQEGHAYAVVQEMADFEHTEFIIFTALGIGFASSLLLAVLLGLVTARHLLVPVTTLARAVAANAAAASLPSLDSSDEIGDLARAFARRTEELERFLVRERLFTGDVSHELRTPLTVMLGAAELLQSQLADRPAQQAAAERLRRVAAETGERVGALLLLSRSPEHLGAPRIALNPVIRQEVERCRPLLAGKPVAYRFEEREEVQVDAHPELIAIAVGNLLRNACQHTEAGTVRIVLESGRLIIEDTGPGIPEGVRTHLFKRFVRGDASRVEGAGLGLSIVKRVVEHLGWTICYEDCDGCDGSAACGSRFILGFPVGGADGAGMLS